MCGICMHRLWITNLMVKLLAVAVSTITFTWSGTMLHNSCSWEYSLRNSFPLTTITTALIAHTLIRINSPNFDQWVTNPTKFCLHRVVESMALHSSDKNYQDLHETGPAWFSTSLRGCSYASRLQTNPTWLRSPCPSSIPLKETPQAQLTFNNSQTVKHWRQQDVTETFLIQL